MCILVVISIITSILMCIVVISNVISILMCIVVVIVIMIKSPEIVINTTLLGGVI